VLVLKILEPIWSSKPETAGRLRGRIEAMLDWAKARRYRDGENPARWRGHLDKVLPRRAKIRKVEHHPALPYTELPQFIAALRQLPGMAARALEFAILTAARSGEVRGATFAEIDIANAVWTVPAARMKAGKEHRIPLGPRALALASEMVTVARQATRGDIGARHVFPGARAARPMSDMSLTQLLRRMGRGDITVHGFRTSFKSWASARTKFATEIVEITLAHTQGPLDAAYQRDNLFVKRRGLMAAWDGFATAPQASARVVRMRQERTA
jgi:integrase